MTSPDTQLLRTFIAREAEAFAARRLESFWGMNHHRISPLLSRVPDLLSPDELTEFYFHYVRLANGLPPVGDKEFPLLLSAYERLLPFIDLPPGISVPSRHRMLYAFGFDETGPLPGGRTASANEYEQHVRLLGQAASYSHLPGQRSKKARFLPFAPQAGRVLGALRHLGYYHDRRHPEEDLYNTVNITFWGMVFICLLNRDTRAGLLSDMLGAEHTLMDRDKHLAILHEYVAVVLPDTGPDEAHFLELAQQLADSQAARRGTTESMALVRALGLPFTADEDWEILISIPLRGSDRPALIAKDRVCLRIRRDPDWQWTLDLSLSGRGEVSESDSRRMFTPNRLGIPPLGCGNLQGFPAWLRQLRAEAGLDFDIEAADIRLGRKRSAAKVVAQWLAG